MFKFRECSKFEDAHRHQQARTCGDNYPFPRKPEMDKYAMHYRRTNKLAYEVSQPQFEFKRS